MALKIELLINRRSRSARLIASTLEKELKASGIKVAYTHEITRRTSLDRVIKKVKQRNPTLLIIGGGDGTFSSVVNQLVGSEIELGLIPLGTTNNFARSLNIPLGDISAAIGIIQSKQARSVDLGKINGEYFTNVAGVGLSALIAAQVTDSAKARFGRFAYALIGLRQLFLQQSFIVIVQDPDHELSVTFETHQLIVANGRYHAGREIAEDAKVDNGQLLIFPLGGRSISSFMLHTIDFYIGKRKKVVHSPYFIGRRVEIHTRNQQPIELDGEVKLKTPVVAEVEAAAIKVRY